MPEPQPTPQPQQDNSWLLWVLIAFLVYMQFSGGVGGGTSPTKNLPAVPSVLTLYDADPVKLLDLQKNHAGQYDVIWSTNDTSVQQWTLKTQGGEFLKYGVAEPKPDEKDVGAWVVEAYDLAKKAPSVPWTVASGPNGKGFSGPTPDGQDAAAKSLKVIGK